MKRSLLLLLLAPFLFSSCENFIDLSPLDKITTKDYWKTEKDLEYYTRQFYPSFFGATQMVADLANNTDDMISGSPSSILNGVRTKSTGNWKGDWRNIRNVNIFFANYHNCQSPLEKYKQFLGEAHFFRAWFYFGLLKKYGDVPWYSKVLEVDSEEELMRPRDPRTLIADSILVDLDKAILYLEPRSVTGNCKISKEAALAFKSRVALFEGTWQKYHAGTPFGTKGADPAKYFKASVSAAEELIKGNYKVGLYSTGNPEVDYYKLFGFDNMNDIEEVLLYKSFSAADGFGNSTQGFITYNANEKGITWDLVSSYLGADGRPYNYLELAKNTKGNNFLLTIGKECDLRLKSTIWMPGDVMSVGTGAVFTRPTIDAGALQLCPTGFQVKKTANPNSPAAGKSWEIQGETGLIIFRYAEVLLNYAEAKWELENVVAYDQLNLLRERVGMADFVVNPQASDPNRIDYGYAISDELYEIRRERRVELALEGRREEDYQRWAAHALFQSKRPKGYPVSKEEFPNYTKSLDENGLIDYFATQLPSGYEFREKQDYLNSIPQDELTLNPNLTQNPNW